MGNPRQALPEVLAWLLAGESDVASVEVREPTLEDAFFAVTGRLLQEDGA